jgi:glyoxalase-like protein
VQKRIPPAGELFLDHIAHFVPDLGAAAQTLQALGFAVTPVSAHRTQHGPSGTSNVCVMLEHGYLEILAPMADTPDARKLHDALRRYAGVHLACFGTPAAEEEQARLASHGFNPPAMVELSRQTETGLAQFKVVRAAPEAMPEGRIQFVQHLTPEVVWHERWLGHRNGVTKLACVFVVADEPADAAARWAHFSALLPRLAGRFAHLQSARGDVLIGRRGDWEHLFGDVAPAAPALAGYALECSDPDALAERATLAGAAVRKLRRGLYAATLPPALSANWVFGTASALAFDR